MVSQFPEKVDGEGMFHFFGTCLDLRVSRIQGPVGKREA